MPDFSQFTDYLLLEKKYATHTVSAYLADLSAFQRFYALQGGTRIDQASYSEIRSWMVLLVEQGLANRSINRKLSSLKAYYRFLLKTEQLQKNPFAKHRALKIVKKIQVPFSQEEVAAVLEILQGISSFEGVRDRLIVELFYATGVRRAELVGLRLGDVDLEGKMIKVLGKRKKERYIPLLPSVLKTMELYLSIRDDVACSVSENFLLLTKKGVKIYEMLVYRVINKYFGETSLKVKKSPHILRHSFATHLLNEGADLNAVKELLGHSSLESTVMYTHHDMVHLSKVHGNSHPRNKK